ncbi:tRNA preQ1(34) S-adenosylmethionine ribosyltransferase-isomerase QueA [Oscillospiraceae bacterium OttesenSCG-928-G22]|nr:tRNA preQ1(34) S-adenosylmethionine ribosyltransferase-isomerase QueA [Oscillospiraceae bacterium OttesenSCG-928-G22]
MKTSDFFYDLPEELIAQTPLSRRDASRLLRLDRRTGATEHRTFSELPDLLRPGDLLVLNNSRVLHARLHGKSDKTGGDVELLLLKPSGPDEWECLVKPGKRCKEGARLLFGGGILTADVLSVTPEGNRICRFSHEGEFDDVLKTLGEMPLPPYIHETLSDPERYQTVYAEPLGSAAAPTAGLHFTPELLDCVRDAGIGIASVTLHVGLGTFRPVKSETLEEHVMHSEYCAVPEETATAVARTKAEGGRVVAVGTTAMRTLESRADASGVLRAGDGWTDIFIYPGYTFKTVDALITNFHLPESTLLMLVSAFAGREPVLRAYREAIDERYRFFSFGDAMLIL